MVYNYWKTNVCLSVVRLTFSILSTATITFSQPAYEIALESRESSSPLLRKKNRLSVDQMGKQGMINMNE
jgi:hypothetical protein